MTSILNEPGINFKHFVSDGSAGIRSEIAPGAPANNSPSYGESRFKWTLTYIYIYIYIYEVRNTPYKGNTEDPLLLFSDLKHGGKHAMENTEKRKVTGRKGRGNRKTIRKGNRKINT